MINTKNETVINTKIQIFYKFLLMFYPESYRKRFSQEMLTVLQDMYQEELTRKGKAGFVFWISQTNDIIKSIMQQHVEVMIKKGMKKYLQNTLHIKMYNIIGLILLLPFITMFFLDFAGRLVQGNFYYPNQQLFQTLYRTPLYWFPILFTWVFIFPILAIVLNIIPLIRLLLAKKSRNSSIQFLIKNPITIAIICLGMVFIMFLSLHDFIPCFLKEVLNKGLGSLFIILSKCRNA